MEILVALTEHKLKNIEYCSKHRVGLIQHMIFACNIFYESKSSSPPEIT